MKQTSINSLLIVLGTIIVQIVLWNNLYMEFI